MDAAPLAATSAVALLADLDPATLQPERVHAVLGWTELGEHHYQPLAVPVVASDCPDLTGTAPSPRANAQLQLDLGEDVLRPTSSGRTWRTWSLPSIPSSMRHLRLGAVVRELAARLGG
jgi:hypothetical protein